MERPQDRRGSWSALLSPSCCSTQGLEAWGKEMDSAVLGVGVGRRSPFQLQGSCGSPMIPALPAPPGGNLGIRACVPDTLGTCGKRSPLKRFCLSWAIFTAKAKPMPEEQPVISTVLGAMPFPGKAGHQGGLVWMSRAGAAGVPENPPDEGELRVLLSGWKFPRGLGSSQLCLHIPLRPSFHP